MAKTPKRPRDLNQWAKHMVDLATGQAGPTEQGTSAKAVSGKSGGLKGGAARAAKLTPEQRAEMARVAAQARWKKST
jgi:hypothetical protein